MISREELNTLLEFKENLLVSIYIPTHRTGNNEKDRLRYKNALQTAAERIEGKGKNENETKEFLSQGYKLLNDPIFWSYLSKGLAIFIGPEHFSYHILPYQVPENVYVADRFYTRPLMNLFSGSTRFFILALSHNEVRLFDADEYDTRQIYVKDLMPESLDESMAEVDVSFDSHTQWHTVQVNKGSSMFHGHGGVKDQEQKRVEDFYRKIDDGLEQILRGSNAPLVIASTEKNVSIFKRLSDYSYIEEESIHGNPEEFTPDQLHKKAWEILKGKLDKRMVTIQEELEENHSNYITDIKEIVTAAYDKRISKLYLDQDLHAFGIYDPEKRELSLEGDNNSVISFDLLEFAARRTLENGGEVYDLPEEKLPPAIASGAAAFLRY